MEIGIGLPGSVPGVSASTVLSWARDADRLGFSSLGTVDRLVYPNLEPITTLAAAAAVTERIRLMTSVLLAPLRSNHALLAKQAATLDQLSEGRLVLGLAVGVRPDDYAVSGVDVTRRGRLFDEQLERMTSIWAGTADGPAAGVGPRPHGGRSGPPLVIGGHSPQALARVARHGSGWIAGVMGPDAFRHGAATVRRTWHEHGRDGEPRLLGLAYYALGHDAQDVAAGYLRNYYARTGPFVDQVIGHAATSGDDVRRTVDAYADAGCDELVFMPCSADPDEIGRLRDATASPVLAR